MRQILTRQCFKKSIYNCLPKLPWQTSSLLSSCILLLPFTSLTSFLFPLFSSPLSSSSYISSFPLFLHPSFLLFSQSPSPDFLSYLSSSLLIFLLVYTHTDRHHSDRHQETVLNIRLMKREFILYNLLANDGWAFKAYLKYAM